MLKLLTEKDIASLLEFCKNSILGTRIACYALCYGFDKEFLLFWGAKNENGFNCIIAKLGNCITILANENSDSDEIAEFIKIIGAAQITTSEAVANKLNFAEFETKTGFIYNLCYLSSMKAENASGDELKEIYTLISKAIPDSFEDTKDAYLSFLSDFTYRQSRGYANAKCIYSDNKIVACALTAAQSENDVLLSGIACDEDYRKYGYGKRIVLSFADEFKKEGKNIFVIALNSSAEGFYKHIGFKECEKIAFIRER